MSALKYGFAPVLLAQGAWVRRRANSLPDPEGALDGVAGQGPELRLLIAGDSSAMGVGTSEQKDALSGQVVKHLSQSFEVHWSVVARTGNTTRQALTTLADVSGRFDVAITALGVNDITRGVPMGRWLSRQAELRTLLKERFGVRRIIVSALPPVHQFPLLPHPTRWVLGREARLYDDALRLAVEQDPQAEHLPFDMELTPEVMSPDGFHPGPRVYTRWGELAAARIVAWRRG